MKNRTIIGVLAALSLVGILIIICGIGLSLGFRSLSVISFFSVVVLLIVFRLIGWSVDSGSKKKG